MSPRMWTQRTRDKVASVIAVIVMAATVVAMAGFVVAAAGAEADEADFLAIEGVWSETSTGFDLMGGAYIIDREADCVTDVDLYETTEGDQTYIVEELGLAGWDRVTLPRGRYFFDVRGDCSWTIRIFRDAPSPT